MFRNCNYFGLRFGIVCDEEQITGGQKRRGKEKMWMREKVTWGSLWAYLFIKDSFFSLPPQKRKGPSSSSSIIYAPHYHHHYSFLLPLLVTNHYLLSLYPFFFTCLPLFYYLGSQFNKLVWKTGFFVIFERNA